MEHCLAAGLLQPTGWNNCFSEMLLERNVHHPTSMAQIEQQVDHTAPWPSENSPSHSPTKTCQQHFVENEFNWSVARSGWCECLLFYCRWYDFLGTLSLTPTTPTYPNTASLGKQCFSRLVWKVEIWWKVKHQGLWNTLPSASLHDMSQRKSNFMLAQKTSACKYWHMLNTQGKSRKPMSLK